MSVWKNIKCPNCERPNDREELAARNGECFYCGAKITGNLNNFMPVAVPAK